MNLIKEKHTENKILYYAFIAILSIFFMSCTTNGTDTDNMHKREFFKSGKFCYKVIPGNESKVELVADTAMNSRTYSGLGGDVTIPASVEYNSKKYTVAAIADSLFAGCDSITSLKLPDGIRKIGNNTFEGCGSITEITLPNALILMGSHVFLDCKNLKSVELPRGLKEIKEYSFYGCSALENIKNSENIQNVGNCAFDKTAWYNKQPQGMVYIGNALYKYKSKSKKDAKLLIKQGTVSISDFAFNGHSEIISITVPSSIKTIGMASFMDCGGLMSVQLPYGVEYIGRNAFKGCKRLILASLSESVKTIEENAFDGCERMKTVRFPRNVVKIGNDAFRGCSSLSEIIVYNNKPISVSSPFSESTFSRAKLIVPDGSLEVYKKADVWKNFKKIKERDL